MLPSTRVPSTAALPPTWPFVPGEAAALIGALDGTRCPLGAPADWPPTLRRTLELILPSQAEVVLFWGPQCVAFYNDSYAPTIGQKHPHAMGRPAAEFWGELWDDLHPLLLRVLELGETVSARDRPFAINRHGAMEEVFFDISYSPIRDDDGRVGGVLCVVSETTARVRATRALAASEEHLRELNATLEERVAQRTHERDRLWRLSADLMIVTRLDGTIVAVNPAWHTLLGWDEHELLGRQCLDFVEPGDLAASTAQLQHMAAGHSTTRFENQSRHKDGSHRAISWSAVPHEGYIHAVGRDITALRASEQQLRHSQKMDAIGQLTGGIAHDFNNMLQGITGALEVMRRRLALGRTDDLGRFMDSATQSALRASSLVHRLLAFARRQSLDRRPLDVNALIDSMEEMMRRTLGEQIRLRIELAPDAGNAFGDESQLESTILNLAINARDAMPHGGELHIGTRHAVLSAAEVEGTPGLQAGRFVAITVRDTGTGMAPDVLARAFDPFFTTKPVGQGTGLGLSMIYGFAQQSGGQVRIDSAPGQGTVVTLLLPHAEAQPAPAPAPVPPARPLPEGRGEVVLVVEDDPGVRLLVLEVLAELGYCAQHAAEGQAALQLLRAGGRIDLMISDVGLPGLNGRQLAEMARELRPGLPVLLMTGYAQHATHRASFLAPGMDMIAKPFRMEELAHRIDAIMKGPAGAREPVPSAVG